MGEGESKHIYSPLLFLPLSNNKGQCRDGVSKVREVASGPRTTLQSHVSVDSSLSQLTKHRVPLVLEDNRCAVHSGAACHSLTRCAHARVSLCCHSSESIAVCDLSFMTGASMRIEYTSTEGKTLKEMNVSRTCCTRGVQHSPKPPFPPLQRRRQPQQPDTGL